MAGYSIHCVTILLLTLSLGGAALKLPSYIQPCSRKLSVEDMNTCALKSAANAVENVVNGDPEYKIPVLNPVRIGKLEFGNGREGLGVNFQVSDVKLWGLKDARIQKILIDLKKHHATLEAFVPNIELDSQYSVSGQILVLPVRGNGRANITLKDVFWRFDLDINIEKGPGGLEYVTPQKGVLDFNITNAYVHLDNLFNGDKLLGVTTNQFLNENWQELAKLVGPVIGESLSESIRRILVNIFKLVPMKDAFPE